jgi:hypothetical protein
MATATGDCPALSPLSLEITVMPAWMAGIQARKDASGNVHVNLDSSAPCWNDVIERFFNCPRPLQTVFSTKRTKIPAQSRKGRQEKLREHTTGTRNRHSVRTLNLELLNRRRAATACSIASLRNRRVPDSPVRLRRLRQPLNRGDLLFELRNAQILD